MNYINRPLMAWDFELSDPSWRRWFDTLKANGVTRLADNSVGVKKGMFSGPTDSGPTFNPQFQGSAVYDQGLNKKGDRFAVRRKSNSIAAPNESLDGIYRITGGR